MLNSPILWFIIGGALVFLFLGHSSKPHDPVKPPVCFTQNDTIESENGQFYYQPTPCENTK